MEIVKQLKGLGLMVISIVSSAQLKQASCPQYLERLECLNEKLWQTILLSNVSRNTRLC